MTKRQLDWVMRVIDMDSLILVVDDDTNDLYDIVEMGQLDRALKGKRLMCLQGRNMVRVK